MIVYDDIKPWGRNYGEYRRMFNLTDEDLDRRILGCGDGPASFNAQMTAMSKSVVSVDPLYAFTAKQIAQRVEDTWADILMQTSNNRQMFVWETYRTPEELGRARLSAMEVFLADYPEGKHEGRYVEARLPDLPFDNGQFDLALCANLLFLYDDHLSLTFHIDAVRELCRVADEVRIFPIYGMQNTLAEQLVPVENALRNDGWLVERRPVQYEFRHGSKQMLVLLRRQ